MTSIELNLSDCSKVSSINLYQTRAEVTRRVVFELPSAGPFTISLNELPTEVDGDSIRVKGFGSILIHDVSVTRTKAPKQPPIPSFPDSSPILKELLSRKEEVEQVISRADNCINVIKNFSKTFDVKSMRDAAEFTAMIQGYEESLAQMDRKRLTAQRELHEINEGIASERAILAAHAASETAKLLVAPLKAKLSKTIKTSIVSEKPGKAEFLITYVVQSASWSALYDVRASTEADAKPLEIVYKANITQNTGEDWEDVPLTLETASPSFGVPLPELTPWKLSVYKPQPPPQPDYSAITRSKPAFSFGRAQSAKRAVSRSADLEEEEDEDMGFGLFDGAPPPAAAPVMASVTSKGDLNATFRVPGLISIPSDGEKHTVTVQNLDLTARLSWVCVPKKDTRVHLMANMLNSSAYTFIPGKANVYVDGSFIANSSLPTINPGEEFRIQLGLDQSVKTTYHPREIKAKESGFLGVGKTSTTLYSQRITVQNTKLSRVDELVIVDQLPVSEDAQITVNLKVPDLSSAAASGKKNGTGATTPTTGTSGTGSVSEKRASTFLGLGSSGGGGGDAARHGSLVKVSDDVYAGWYTDDNHGLPSPPPVGGAAAGPRKDDLGKDGKVKWVCGLGSQAKATLLLQWEVSVGSGVSVVGLHSA